MVRRNPPYNPAGHLGLPTPQRAKKAGGFKEDNLGLPGAPVPRATAKAALTHPEASERRTFLDRALEDMEVHALFRFCIARQVSNGRMRLSPQDDRLPIPVQNDGTGRLPFGERERREIDAHQFVYSRLPMESQRDIDIFVDQIFPPTDKRGREFYISPNEFGAMVSRSTDDRVNKGAYIGTFKKLAHHLNHLYVEWELNLFRRTQEAKVAKKSRIAAEAEEIVSSRKKVLAK